MCRIQFTNPALPFSSNIVFNLHNLAIFCAASTLICQEGFSSQSQNCNRGKISAMQDQFFKLKTERRHILFWYNLRLHIYFQTIWYFLLGFNGQSFSIVQEPWNDQEDSWWVNWPLSDLLQSIGFLACQFLLPRWGQLKPIGMGFTSFTQWAVLKSQKSGSD